MTPLLCLDIETTGLDPENHQVLEIAAIVVNDELPKVLPPLGDLKFPVFHCLVKHKEIRGDAYALQLNAGILQELAGLTKTGICTLPPWGIDGAVEHLADFLRKHLVDDQRKYTVAGKNVAGFDIPFLMRMDAAQAAENFALGMRWNIAQYFSHRTLDIGNLFWVPEDDGFAVPNFEKCMIRGGISPTGLHRALGDAYDVLRLVHARCKGICRG